MKGYTANEPALKKGYPGVTISDIPETFSLDEDDLKAIKTWKVGKQYDLRMTVKLVSQSQDSPDKTMRARFEIVNVDEDDGEDADG